MVRTEKYRCLPSDVPEKCCRQILPSRLRGERDSVTPECKGSGGPGKALRRAMRSALRPAGADGGEASTTFGLTVVREIRGAAQAIVIGGAVDVGKGRGVGPGNLAHGMPLEKQLQPTPFAQLRYFAG